MCIWFEPTFTEYVLGVSEWLVISYLNIERVDIQKLIYPNVIGFWIFYIGIDMEKVRCYQQFFWQKKWLSFCLNLIELMSSASFFLLICLLCEHVEVIETVNFILVTNMCTCLVFQQRAKNVAQLSLLMGMVGSMFLELSILSRR